MSHNRKVSDIGFLYCPQCGEKNISQTDYENNDGEDYTEWRRCNYCGWEGDISKLVCIKNLW